MPTDQTNLTGQTTNLQQPTDTDISLNDTVTNIENELLQEIISRLKENKMTPQESQQLAKQFLALLPFHDKKDLLKKLLTLSQNNNAVSGIYLRYAVPHEEQDRQKKLELMSKHIQEGNIEHALSVAKGDKQNV